MFVELTNGCWVHEPIIFGDEWFIRLDGGEVLFTVHTYRSPSEAGLRKRMRKILRENGISATLNSEVSDRGEAPFPPNFNGLKQCATVRIEITGPVPAELGCHAGIITSIRPEQEEIVNGCLADS